MLPPGAADLCKIVMIVLTIQSESDESLLATKPSQTALRGLMARQLRLAM